MTGIISMVVAIAKQIWKHRKTISVAIVVGGLVMLYAGMYAKMKFAQASEADAIAKFKQLEFRHGVCMESNAEWERAYKMLADSVTQWSNAESFYREESARVRDRWLAEMARADDLENRIDSIDAIECPDAVDQLIVALDWGTE